MSLLGIVFSIGALAPAPTSFVLPLDPAAVDERGHKLYVSDAAIRAAIPSFKDAGPRIGTCINSMFIPASGYIDLMPKITGTHHARLFRLDCSLGKTNNVACSESRADPDVVFDTDPHEYLWLESGVELEVALDIYRAFRDKQVEFPPGKERWIKGLSLRSLKRQGDSYVAGFSDCGCNESWVVERRLAAGKSRIFAIKPGQAICI